MDNSLFSEEIWDATIEDSQENKGPVKVLGMEFANDDERRAYFREELRKKLPDLKQIEGFPIGKDDDIVNLSDPPYYTACPNPWLNDFIQEWEKEKLQLEIDGKRTPDFEVREPYASDVSEGKSNPIYMAHAYHTKVPHPAIMRYILHYTQPGDIVFDGFAGTGMTGVAANKCALLSETSLSFAPSANPYYRHGICSDLSPIATMISAAYNLSFNFVEFNKKALDILRQVESELGWMYETEVNGLTAKVNYWIWSEIYTCPNCGRELNLWDETVSLSDETISDKFECPNCGVECNKSNMTVAKESYYDKILNGTISRNKRVPVRVNYSLGNKRGEQDVTEWDLELLRRVEDLSLDAMSTIVLPDGDEIHRLMNVGVTHLHMLYTLRNYIYLSRVKELIGDDVLLNTWFTSVQQNASLMYKFRLDRKGGIISGTFYIPSLNIEQSPYKLLLGKLNDFNKINYCDRGHSLVSTGSSTELSTLNDDSIDYIFIDPPFGANIMYSELSSLWEGWLHVQTNNKEEAIICNYQDKSLFDYQKLMLNAFKEFYRVLKPGKWITIEFSNTSASVWNTIQHGLQSVGFIVVNVSALDKKQGSFKAVNTLTAVKQDLIITCFKPTDKLTRSVVNSCEGQNTWNFVEELLLHLPVHVIKNNSTTAIVERSPKILYDRLISYYVERGYPVPLDANEFQKGLCERFVERDGMYFTASQVSEYEEKKKLAPEFIPMGLIVSNEADGIEWLRNRLRVHGPQTYQEIQPEWMQAINGLRKNDILPELKDLLYENFIEEADGKWRLPNVQDDVDKAALRTKALLKEFKIYVEVAQKPKAKLKEVRVEAVRAGFKQCYIDKDFQTIVTVGDKIPQNLLTEDEILLQFYDIAINHV